MVKTFTLKTNGALKPANGNGLVIFCELNDICPHAEKTNTTCYKPMKKGEIPVIVESFITLAQSIQKLQKRGINNVHIFFSSVTNNPFFTREEIKAYNVLEKRHYNAIETAFALFGIYINRNLKDISPVINIGDRYCFIRELNELASKQLDYAGEQMTNAAYILYTYGGSQLLREEYKYCKDKQPQPEERETNYNIVGDSIAQTIERIIRTIDDRQNTQPIKLS